ncbi:Uncharacterised protein [Bordetella ansorpii]|uniref:Uncharacterized protein n=1 Tax=Bordetella ansorpii TaxID=288768 RepID=A0A157QM15_9BORD|nr:hypothetical protein [Bordetella ansorpii]SAI46807.1 Uncharacterised protein [Bordetella ansorpii]
MKAGLVLVVLLGSLALTAYTYGPFLNAQGNHDGARTVPRGQQTPQSNALRQQFCQARGGVDVTDEGDVTVSAGAAHVIVCQFPQGSPPDTGGYVPIDPLPEGKALSPDVPLRPAPPSMPGTHGARDDGARPYFGFISESSLDDPAIAIYPVNQFSVATGQSFYAAGTFVFANVTRPTPVSIRAAIPALNCSWLWDSDIPKDDTTITGYMACHAWRRGGHITHITACVVDAACTLDQGAIVIAPGSGLPDRRASETFAVRKWSDTSGLVGPDGRDATPRHRIAQHPEIS